MVVLKPRGGDMDRMLVKSSNLISVGYDSASKTLEIEFQSGKTYQYYGVPESVYQDLMTASSKGQFVHDHIYNEYDFAEA
jgi:hypothetical protein